MRGSIDINRERVINIAGQSSGKPGNFKSVNDIKKARDKADKAKRDKVKRDAEAVRKEVKKSKNKKRKK